MAFSWYVQKNTYLHRLNPIAKLSIVFAVWLSAFIFQSPLWNALLLASIVALLAVVRIPYSSIVSFLKVVIPVMIVILVFFTLTGRSGRVLLDLGWFQIMWGGLSSGLIAASRIGVLFFSTIGILFTTTKERDLLVALVKLKLPFGAAFLLMLTIRFISLSMADLTIIMSARRARAIPEHENVIQILKNATSIVVPLFVLMIRRIQTASNALEVKGFAPDKKTKIGVGKLTRFEATWASSCLGLVVVLAWLRVYFGFFVS